VEIYRECLAILDTYARLDTGMLPLSKGEFALLCHCIITCATIEDVIARAAAFSGMIQNRAGEINLEIVGDQARFEMKSLRVNYNINAFFVDLTGVVSYYRLFGWLIGEDIEPVEIEMRHNQFVGDDVVAQIISCPVTYSNRSNVLQFPARYLKYPVIRTPFELAELLKKFPFEPMMPQSREAPISERLRLNFNTALAERKPLPRTAALAKQLSIGVTTLKRRLAEEGGSVKSIKERCRYELALSLLKDRHLTIGDIASRVGFSDATAFRRAFKSWTGASPYKYRNSIRPA
jgi:AraC-like DNA-binding protein